LKTWKKTADYPAHASQNDSPCTVWGQFNPTSDTISRRLFYSLLQAISCSTLSHAYCQSFPHTYVVIKSLAKSASDDQTCSK